MKPFAPPERSPAIRAEPIAARLPALPPSAARAARIGHDRRFQHWLRALLGHRVGPVVAAQPTSGHLSIDLHGAHGSLDIAVDPGHWPALQMAAALPDATLAAAVADALLQPISGALAGALPGLKVRSLRRPPASGPMPTVQTQGGSAVTLMHLDGGIAAHLETQLRRQPSSLQGLAALRLPARLCVLERPFTRRQLEALAPGDMVLCGAGRRRTHGRWQANLLIGSGITMQADTDIELEHASVRLAEPPRLADEEALAPQMPALDGATLADLQVPVAFELDSARISLGELASLDAGSVIELDVPLLEAGVRLVCHGQTVGVGQLVAIGDQLGVRIRRMGLAAAPRGAEEQAP